MDINSVTMPLDETFQMGFSDLGECSSLCALVTSDCRLGAGIYSRAHLYSSPAKTRGTDTSKSAAVFLEVRIVPSNCQQGRKRWQGTNCPFCMKCTTQMPNTRPTACLNRHSCAECTATSESSSCSPGRRFSNPPPSTNLVSHRTQIRAPLAPADKPVR
jgi:hypothetical protein